MCGAIHLTLWDPIAKDVPRNPLGYRITMADFDMSVSGASVAGRHIDPSHFQACGCLGGVAGSAATVTATYPAQALPAAARAPNVSFQKTASFVLALPKGMVNPPPCALIASAPANPSPPGQLATTPVTRLVPTNPTGMLIGATGHPGQISIAWKPVPDASFYVVFGTGLTPGGQRVENKLEPANGAYAMHVRVVANNVPGGWHTYLVASYYDPGNISTPSSEYSKARMYMPELE
jgi:hypothetical protein